MCFLFACNLQYEIVISARNFNLFLFMCFHSAINIFIIHCLSAISSEGLNLVALVKVCLLSGFFLFGMFELELDVVDEVDVECF